MDGWAGRVDAPGGWAWVILPGDRLTWEDEEDVMQADQQEESTEGRHAAPEGAERHPLIDLDRDPTPGVANHAKDEDE